MQGTLPGMRMQLNDLNGNLWEQVTIVGVVPLNFPGLFLFIQSEKWLLSNPLRHFIMTEDLEKLPGQVLQLGSAQPSNSGQRCAIDQTTPYTPTL